MGGESPGKTADNPQRSQKVTGVAVITRRAQPDEVISKEIASLARNDSEIK